MYRYASSGDIYEGQYKAGKKVRRLAATTWRALPHRQHRQPQRALTCRRVVGCTGTRAPASSSRANTRMASATAVGGSAMLTVISTWASGARGRRCELLLAAGSCPDGPLVPT